MDEQDTIQLQTRHSPTTGRFQIHVDGRWRQRQSWNENCFRCWREDGQTVQLQYHGCTAKNVTGDEPATLFWSVCPRCGAEGATHWIGKPQEHSGHGMGHGHLRFRRASSGY